MALAPRTEADSKVSIDCSRYRNDSVSMKNALGLPFKCLNQVWAALATHVEGRQSLAVLVKLIVVELNEFLC